MTLTAGKLILAKDYPADADVKAYIAAVEAADELDTPGIGALEPAVVAAYDNFIVGCKSDGIWDAIKVSCILAGAKTLEGSFIDLKSATKILTNNNFADGTYVGNNYTTGDYDRKTGLKGDGTTKNLNSNRNNNADPQNNNHNSVFTTVVANEPVVFLLASPYSSTGWNSLNYDFRTGTQVQAWSRGGAFPAGNRAWSGNPGFLGSSRSASNQYLFRVDGSTGVLPYTSSPPSAGNIGVQPGLNGRLAFYSIGEALDLALLDARVSTLISDLGAAIQ